MNALAEELTVHSWFGSLFPSLYYYLGNLAYSAQEFRREIGGLKHPIG